ncbi:MAG: hypothetical protein WD535_04390, partial [Thermaerobacterales bacterium]
ELKTSLDTIDMSESAGYWGERGHEMIAASLERELAGRTLAVRPIPGWGWLEIPVTLQIKGHSR